MHALRTVSGVLYQSYWQLMLPTLLRNAALGLVCLSSKGRMSLSSQRESSDSRFKAVRSSKVSSTALA